MKLNLYALKKCCYVKNWLGNNKRRLILLLMLYPNIVCFTPDSTGTSSSVVDFLLGIGRYAHVTYNCEGQATSVTRYSYFDYGGSFTHNIDIFKFGARAGGYSINYIDKQSNYYNDYYYYGPYTSNAKSVQYINPFVGFETKYFDLNVGLVVLSQNSVYGHSNKYFFGESSIQPSWFLRIGNREKFHFSTEYFSNVPIFSGGGIADMGFGFGSEETRNLTWVGASLGPYQNLGVTIRQNIQVTDNMDILLRGRVGMIESEFEGGVSAGIRFNL